MQQVWLSVDDLTRTYVQASRGIWIEAVFGVHALRYREGDSLFAGWRRQAYGRVGSVMDHLVELWPRPSVSGHRPGLLTESDHPEEIDALRFAPGWSDLADRARAELVIEALHTYTKLAVEPYWDAVQAVLEGARARLVRISGEAGVEALLSSLHPAIRWRPPWLEIGEPATGGDIDGRTADVRSGPDASGEERLDGRGLEIVPSFFCPPGYPLVRWADREDAPDVLFVPAARGLRLGQVVVADGAGRRALGLLVGQTRASVLRVVSDGACTTSELARRSGISVSAASQHARVLREAGLIRSERHRSAVIHTLTPLGAQLVGRSF